ncbi:MAG: type II toxin-antitoxin system ParD family antitoxin [Rhodospirillales bacterium]|jgi:antitoxin ParD1/3/4|nr:type II toxin-antitoxin system ParD family antitoxin [Rhodospirillales bacterium]
MPSEYTLSSHFEAFVRSLVLSGRYSSASEVLEDGLRLLERRERALEARLDGLRSEVEDGRASGLSDQDGEAFLAELEAKYATLSAR